MSRDNTTETTRADLIERLVEDMRYDMEEEVNAYESSLENLTDEELKKEAADRLDETVLIVEEG